MSGALGLAPLTLLAARGHAIGCFHPLQSFPQVRSPAAFAGSLIAVDAGTEPLLQDLQSLATSIGGRPRHVKDAERPLYHAAAVLASNYVVALAAQAATILEDLGWKPEDALPAILPLMKGVISNLEAYGLEGSLIGPIRRGDAGTVQRHLAALASLASPRPAEVYRSLGLAALDLAQPAGLEPAAAAQIKLALTGRPGSDLKEQ